jgi:hypothetical protein
MAETTQHFTLEGTSELMDQLRALGTIHRDDLVVRAVVVKSLKIAMQPVLDMAVSLAPYDEVHNKTGIHLRNTLRIDGRIPTDTDKNSYFYSDDEIAFAMVSAKKSAVSLSQEFGNARTPAHPFLMPSFQANIDRMLTVFKSQMQEIIPMYTRKLARRNIK